MIAETFTRNGYTVEIHYDEDCESPREYTNLGLFLGLPHQRYLIGDEQINLDEYEAGSLAELAEEIRKRYSARVLLPVGMIDHSGVSYYVGGGAHLMDPGGWDSGTCGFILTTPETIAKCGSEDYYSDEDLERILRAEIDEYDKWARGDCYGYVIEDLNGDTVDSCWGFIGFDYAKGEAEACVPDASEQPEPLYPVRLTREQMETLDLPVP